MPFPLANPLHRDSGIVMQALLDSVSRLGHTLENLPGNRYTAFTAHFVTYWRTTETTHQSLLFQEEFEKVSTGEKL